MSEDEIIEMAKNYADTINCGSISPKSLLISFASKIASRFYLVSKDDADRLYQGYNSYPDGWSENSDFVSDLERIIPELKED